MSYKKKDLEIIYNLQWKNKPANGGDKANIIGMYDIPSTTLNWEIFKSYLLKNSGTVGEDVKVSYITDSNREFPIENQTDFQIALYAFRRKSRMGDIVNLKLDRISEQPTCKNLRNSNDVETQFSNEAPAQVSTCCSSESPPEWFTAYMSQFKKNITKEITATVSCIVSNIKPHTVSQPTCYHMRKSKPEGSKRIRKLPTLTGESSHETKDIIKSLKIEGKLERKLEKLEHKTKKIRDKKLALFSRSSDSEAGPSGGKSAPPQSDKVEEELAQMGASPVNTQKVVPHMLGGEVYLHQWEVMNTGKLQWTKQTALLFTWGSKALKPLDTIVPVPLLKPGEIGTLSVRLQIPNYPGQYECYWHFHHKERRFGHWLGCQVIVDQFDLKGNRSVLETSFESQPESTPKSVESIVDKFYPVEDVVNRYSNVWQGTCLFEEAANIFDEEADSDKNHREKLVRALGGGIGDIKLQDPTDTNCSSDSDNQSITSLSGSYSSKRVSHGYVVVRLPEGSMAENSSGDSASTVVPPSSGIPAEAPAEDKPKLVDEQAECLDGNNNSGDVDQNSAGSAGKGDDARSNSSRKSDIVMVTMPEDGEKDGGEYVFVIVDGKKMPIPKKIIKSEYLQTVSQRSGGSTPENLSKFSSANSSVEILNKEEMPTPTLKEVSTIIDTAPAVRETIENTDTLELSELHSHCSAAGSCFSDMNSSSEKNARLFVFPQDCPGYEVVGYPVDELAQTAEGITRAYTWAESETQYAHPDPNPDGPRTLFHPLPELLHPTPESNPFVCAAPEAIERPLAAALEARVDPQPLNLSPQQRPLPAQGPTPVLHDISEGSFTPTSDPSGHRESESPNRDFLATERARRPSSGFLGSETLFQGATTALNTARSVINRMVPQEVSISSAYDVPQQPGKWVNGHWVSTNPETPREANLQALAEMGFWNRDLNATLLARYNDDLSRVVAELVQ